MMVRKRKASGPEMFAVYRKGDPDLLYGRNDDGTVRLLHCGSIFLIVERFRRIRAGEDSGELSSADVDLIDHANRLADLGESDLSSFREAVRHVETEKGAAYLADSSLLIKSRENVPLSEARALLSSKYDMRKSLIDLTLGEEPDGADDGRAVRHGGVVFRFLIDFPRGWDESRMRNLTDGVIRSYDLAMSNIPAVIRGRIEYGDIEVRDGFHSDFSMRGNYAIETDDIQLSVSSGLRGMMTTIMHEMAHRWALKVATKEQLDRIRELNRIELKAGDDLVLKDNWYYGSGKAHVDYGDDDGKMLGISVFHPERKAKLYFNSGSVGRNTISFPTFDSLDLGDLPDEFEVFLDGSELSGLSGSAGMSDLAGRYEIEEGCGIEVMGANREIFFRVTGVLDDCLECVVERDCETVSVSDSFSGSLGVSPFVSLDEFLRQVDKVNGKPVGGNCPTEYSRANFNEFVAECFCYAYARDPDPVVNRKIEMVRKRMGDGFIREFKGIVERG